MTTAKMDEIGILKKNEQYALLANLDKAELENIEFGLSDTGLGEEFHHSSRLLHFRLINMIKNRQAMTMAPQNSSLGVFIAIIIIIVIIQNCVLVDHQADLEH